MAYRLKHKESVPEGFKRIAREEIGSAIKYLHGKGRLSRDEAIHEVRKIIKKLRAVLRLVRADLGDVYAVENTRLRDAGQKLSELRDAGALVAAFDGLKDRSPKPLDKRTLAWIRRSVTLHKKHVEQDIGVRNVMQDVAGVLAACLHSARRWPLETDGFAAVEPGLEKTFRDGKKALAVVRKHGGREEFHNWRKRVKDHWYHVRLLENLWGDVMKGYEQSLKELEDALGEDLNLAILREQILSAPGAPGKGAVNHVVKAIDASRKELRQRALAIGRRVYALKPRQFTKQMGRLWSVWREKAI
jgi:CHAD domain-containing protein